MRTMDLKDAYIKYLEAHEGEEVMSLDDFAIDLASKETDRERD
jgi:hypothetical protein